MAVAAFAVPGTASAKGKKGVVKENCSSETAIKGEGSSAQKVAQQNVWIPGFETSANSAACSGTQGGKKTPAITYAPEGSGAGLKAFGAEKEPIFHGKTVQYAGTDEPPNETQKNEIEAHEATPGAEKEALYSLPVLQFSVTAIVHLPHGCTATSAKATGRLALGNETLNKLWLDQIKTWGELVATEKAENPANADSITGTGCAEAKIKHIVRLDQSGTTHVFKKYLGLISTEKVPFENVKHESVGTVDWDETAEGAENTSWPVADEVIRPAAKGGGEVAKLVAETESSIGYVNLPEARASKFVPGSEGGEGTERFWAVLQNSGTASETKAAKKQKYADPATNGDVAAKANANCVKEKYTNGKGTKFPPKSAKGLWNDVTTETKEKAYPLCGLTYDLAVTPFKLFVEAPAEGQATTVVDYLGYVLNEEAEGGQVKIEGNDYERLPAKLDKEAKAGLAEVSE
ncbi:MAG TPA: substrate-binding domain-containing protein [Solirubrobacteraceae bacterium]|nr:substrate-binding domain-containing protein [Solirubrobacteraceae bacterium]